MNNFKIWDHNRKSWIPIDSVEWKFKDLIPKPIYPNIELVQGTGINARKRVKILKGGELVETIILSEIFKKDTLISPDGTKYHCDFGGGKFLLISDLGIEAGLENLYDWLIIGNQFEGEK